MTTSIRSLLIRFCLRAREVAILDRLISALFQLWYDLPFNPFYLPRPHTIDGIFQHTHHLPVPPTHFYSPLPDIAQVKRNISRWYKESDCLGIDWNTQGQISLLEELGQYSSEVMSLPTFDSVTKNGYGLGYGEIEAHFLYLMLRHLKPRRVIEVGSGVSTFFTLCALHANRDQAGIDSDFMCIEPFPAKKLIELVAEQAIILRVAEVQDVPLSVFCGLSAHDVLFIDSSHVSKKDSDVDFLVLEVLPRLRKGVVVHIHDMPFPMPAIPLEHPLFNQYLLWNESALMKAFLLFNEAYQITLCQSYLYHKNPEALKRAIQYFDPAKHFPSSLWLEKVK